MAAGSTGSTFPKWQLAVLLGAPLAFGIGYLYWKNQSTESSEKKKLNPDKKEISLDDNDTSASISKVNKETSQSEPSSNLSPLAQAQEYKNQGNKLFTSSKYDEAIEQYDKAIEICPKEKTSDLSTFYQNRAAAYELLKKWSSVKDDCTKALELNPKYIKALHRRARALEHLNDLANSLEDITATCILENFQNQNSLTLADRVLNELGRKHAREAMKTKKPFLQSKHFIKTYFSSFSEDPIRKIVVASSQPKGFIKAKQALDTQNYEAIIPLCTDEIESSEAESEYKIEATLLRATFYLLSGSYIESLVDLNSIINNTEVNKKIKANALIKRASLNMQLEKHEDCFIDFNEAERVDPVNADVFLHRGQVLVLVEKLDDALKDFERSIKIQPNQPLSYIHKCYAEYRCSCINQNQMQLMNAMNEFNVAIEKYPNCVECYSLLAQVLSDQQQFEMADQYFEKATKVDPLNATIFVHRGLLQLQWAGNIDKAVELISKAIELDDKCEFAYETLGSIEVQRANYETAIELFNSALELAKSEMELVHIYSLKDAAVAQVNVCKKLGFDLSARATTMLPQ